MANYVEQLSFTPYVNPYVKGPVEEYKDLQTELRNRYDVVSSKYDALKSEAQKMAALQPDESKKKAIVDEVNNQFKQAVEAGDFENRDRIVNQAILKFQKDYSPIAQQVKSYQDRKAYYDERVKSKTLTPEEAQQALKYEMDMYSKQREDGTAGFENDPETGEARKGFGSYAKDRTNTFDVNKHVLDIIKPKLDNPNDEVTQVIKENGRYVYTTASGKKQVLPQELQKLVFDSFKSNEQWQNYEKDKAFYDTYHLDDNELNQEKLNIIQKEIELLQSKELTDSVLNKVTEQFKKQGISNPKEKALIELRKQGYLDSNFVKDRVNGLVNADAKSLLLNNLINNSVSKVAGFASDYAYKETEYKEDFKAWTKEHELEAEKKFIDAQNTWNTQATTSYEDYTKSLSERQSTATKLSSVAQTDFLTHKNNFIKDNNLPANFHTLSFANQLNKLKSTLPEEEFKKQASQLLKSNGIKGDLNTVIENASDILDSYNNYKKGKEELNNIRNINKNVYEVVKTNNIENNSGQLFSNLQNDIIAKDFFDKHNIKSSEDLAMFLLNNNDKGEVGVQLKKIIEKSKVDNSIPENGILTTKGNLHLALENLTSELRHQKQNKKEILLKTVDTGFVLSNPNEKSTIGGLNKTIEEALKGSLGNQIVSGTDNFDLNSYLNGEAEKKGYTIKNYKLQDAKIYSTSSVGNKKVRLNIIVEGEDGKERIVPVDVKPGPNEDLINKTMLSSYKAGTLPLQSNLLIEQGYYNEAISNPEDLDMLENLETTSVTLQGNGAMYKVEKMPNGRLRLTEKNTATLNDSFKTIEEVKQRIGQIETKEALRKNNI